MIEKILSKGEAISLVGAWISGCILFGTAILITIEVILRKVFSFSMGGADEISGYAMAAACSWSFGFALFKKAHIRIDVLYIKFPQVIRYALDIASLILFAVYTSVLSYFGFHVFLTSLNRNSTANTPLHTPLWIPQLLWVSGLILFTLVIYLILIATISRILSGNHVLARRLSGATTLEEEIEDGIVGVDPHQKELAGDV